MSRPPKPDSFRENFMCTNSSPLIKYTVTEVLKMFPLPKPQIMLNTLSHVIQIDADSGTSDREGVGNVKGMVNACLTVLETRKLVGIPILAFYFQGKPFKRGFFCDDESLRYPYRESTVENWLLYSYGLVLPFAIIIVTEFVLKICTRETTANFFWEAYENILVFLFGAGCTQLLTDIGKYTIGRLRPHFFAVCAPNVDCNDPRLRNVYIENFECRGRDSHLLKDMRLSFPSGHSSISAYSMVFISMYCGAKLVGSGSRWVKRVIQYFSIVLALYTGFSRVSDYKHHWSDVLAGLTLGTLTAVLVLFSRTSKDVERKTVSSPGENIPLAETPEGPERTYTMI